MSTDLNQSIAPETLACWIAPFVVETSFAWPIIATALVALALYLAFCILPNYVRVRADYYAESFFAAVLQLAKEGSDTNESTETPKESQESHA